MVWFGAFPAGGSEVLLTSSPPVMAPVLESLWAMGIVVISYWGGNGFLREGQLQTEPQLADFKPFQLGIRGCCEVLPPKKTKQENAPC